jgi:hypothetical protein
MYTLIHFTHYYNCNFALIFLHVKCNLTLKFHPAESSKYEILLLYAFCLDYRNGNCMFFVPYFVR